MANERYIVLGPPASDPNCYIVYDTITKGSMPLNEPAAEYKTYEEALEMAELRERKAKLN